MARKRLLTILAAAVAAVGLQVAPATALDLDVDLEVTKVEASVSEDGVEARLGDEDEGVSAKVSDDGVDAEVGDQKVSTRKAADEVEEPDDDGDGSEESSTSKDDGGDAGSSSGSTREVTTAGGARSVGDQQGSQPERPDALDPEQARRFIPGSQDAVDLSGPNDDVTPAFDLPERGGDDFDDPIVAAPHRSADAPVAGDWEPVSPDPERSDAELAAIPAGPEGGSVPAGLKLLAGLLVAGTGTVWHLTRRELDGATPVRAG